MPKFDVSITRCLRLVGQLTISARTAEAAEAHAQTIADEAMERGFTFTVGAGKPAIEWQLDSEEVEDVQVDEL